MQGWPQDDPVAPSRAPPPAFDLDRGEVTHRPDRGRSVRSKAANNVEIEHLEPCRSVRDIFLSLAPGLSEGCGKLAW